MKDWNNNWKVLIKRLSSGIKSEIESSNAACKHYTGFPTNERLSAVYEFLNPGINGENVILYDNQVNKNFSGGARRAMLPFTCFLMTLIRLRRNFSVKHLAFLFQVAESTISNTFNTWIHFSYLRLGSISIWPTLEQVRESLPKSTKEKFPSCRCVIVCVEFEVEVLSSHHLHEMMYSDYKSRTTVKVLVGIGVVLPFFTSSSWKHIW